MRRIESIPARAIIRTVYGKPSNTIYPHLISIGKINRDMAFELRWGYGSPGERLFHVFIAEYNQDSRMAKRRTDLNSQFSTQALANHYIAMLKREHPTNTKKHLMGDLGKAFNDCKTFLTNAGTRMIACYTEDGFRIKGKAGAKSNLKGTDRKKIKGTAKSRSRHRANTCGCDL